MILRILVVMVPVLFGLLAIASWQGGDPTSAIFRVTLGVSVMLGLIGRLRQQEGHEDIQRWYTAAFIALGVGALLLGLTFVL